MKGYDIANSAAVIKLASMEITGNVIPLEWFNHIKRPNGKPYTDAIVLLSDIVYWYRPIEIRDEKSGKLIGFRKKFKADKLQRDYTAFAEQYGYTKNQVRGALAHLQSLSLIDLDFRHPVIEGKKLGNVLYIGLGFDALLAITHPLSNLNLIGYQKIIGDPLDFKVDTNTEITTETSTEVNGGGGESDDEPNVFAAYEQEIGVLTPSIAEALKDLEDQHTSQWVIAAMKVASANNKRSLSYFTAILNRWSAEGYGTEMKPTAKNGHPQEKTNSFRAAILASKEKFSGNS